MLIFATVDKFQDVHKICCENGWKIFGELKLMERPTMTVAVFD